MNDFDRTLQLTNTAQESAGATTAQHAWIHEKYGGCFSFLTNSLDKKIITTITDSEINYFN